MSAKNNAAINAWATRVPVQKEQVQTAVDEVSNVPGILNRLRLAASGRGDFMSPSHSSPQGQVVTDLESGLANAIISESFGLAFKGNDSHSLARNLAEYIAATFTFDDKEWTVEAVKEKVDAYANAVQETVGEVRAKAQRYTDSPADL